MSCHIVSVTTNIAKKTTCFHGNGNEDGLQSGQAVRFIGGKILLRCEGNGRI